MSAALGLYRLQQVDSQIDQIRARLKVIDATLQNDIELRAAMEHFTAADTKHASAERELKMSDAEVEKQRIKIQQTEASLYGGAVQNPKELQDLQNDVASLKRHLDTLESRELDAMAVVETAESELKSATAVLEKVKASRSSQNIDLTKEIETLQKNLVRLESERKAVSENITTDFFTVYDQLRQQRRGIAVTTLSDSSCAACGTTLTPSQQQSARSTSQLFNCPTCGRILFAN
ncbi:MAG TPA: C4-type zinc ribbon domain-containing protein [Anaerolineales bacterium]|nr:C4-type zinc ribbon domain-containing protein [Anaerolineales bacterium]